ncbi:hypothetical protein LWI29_032563 [Acer saccharum]|uniref:RNase H type-1 domain-containing protein n=1 Tax=Acer saccharum TaxID=4024 RepID=A0AA39VZH4_ACESA|nr:hypothetical protein LWI29_032563 [Acer saccharum]
MPPEAGVFKINCDAVVETGACKTGIGVVIRDEAGFVLASCSQIISANFDLETAKTMAVYRGLIFSRDCGLTPCCLEIDSEKVVKRIVDGGCLDANSGAILASIASLMEGSRLSSITHIHKEANRVALELAKNALCIDEDLFWLEDVPWCISSLIEAEKPS